MTPLEIAALLAAVFGSGGAGSWFAGRRYTNGLETRLTKSIDDVRLDVKEVRAAINDLDGTVKVHGTLIDAIRERLN